MKYEDGEEKKFRPQEEERFRERENGGQNYSQEEGEYDDRDYN